MVGEHFAHHRIAWSRALVASALLLAFLGTPGAVLGVGWIAVLSGVLGYALLAFACLWRIWCHLFIAGSKNGELATGGPYSVVRNPLYLGNFLGALGFGFAVEQPLLAIGLGLAFVLLYPAVVTREERDLAQRFGERYRAYCAVVPRWIPDWSRYAEPKLVTLSPAHMRRAMLDAIWFLWAFALWRFVEALHQTNLLPALS